MKSKYVAFISYAREDEGFARKLEAEIEAHPPPDGRTAVNVFRDRSDLTGSEYHGALEKHLSQSETLLVLCSPDARASKFVDDEIRRFAKLHGPDRIFPILLSGLADNEAEDQKAFPPALLEIMGGIPLGAEYRGLGKRLEQLSTGRYETEWYKLLGNIYGMSPAEIRRQDKRHLQQWVGFLKKTVLFLGLLAIFSLLWGSYTLIKKNEALTKEKRALESEKRTLENVQSVKNTIKYLSTKENKPPLYIQVWREDQQKLAEKLADALLSSPGFKYTVPKPYQILRVGPTGASELRYFKDKDKDNAAKMAEALRTNGLGDVTIKLVRGYETTVLDGQLELWMGEGFKELSPGNLEKPSP